MEKPLSVTFRGFDGTPAANGLIEQRVDKLQRHCDHIMGVEVAVEMAHKSMRSGSNYRVRVDATVPPGHEVVSEYNDNDTDGPVPLQTAIHRAFDGAEKQLDKLSAKQRGAVKTHPQQEPTGTVTKLFESDRYGFLLTTDGREVYFRGSSVLDDRFDDLELGAAVHFNEEAGNEGPQASSVRLIDKRGSDSPMEPG